MKKVLSLILIAAMLIVPLASCGNKEYDNALSLYNAGDYEQAGIEFEALGDYSDSADKAQNSKYLYAENLYNLGNYEKAVEIFEKLGDYKDSVDKANNAKYLRAEALFGAEKFEEAAAEFENLGEFKESAQKALESRYNQAGVLFDEGRFADAKAVYEKISNYKDSADKIKSANKELVYQTYSEVFSALEEGVWFYESTSANAVNLISFTKETAKISSIYYDGNGAHSGTPTNREYTVDDTKITLTLADKSQMEITYKLEDGKITLGNGEYFTPEQVDEGLQGYWGIYKITYNQITGFGKAEHIYYFENGKVKYENAALAYGYTDGRYYYYGPYEGTYEINENGLVVEGHNTYQFGFVISEGKVAMCRCGDVLTVYDGFKGEDGYSF